MILVASTVEGSVHSSMQPAVVTRTSSSSWYCEVPTYFTKIQRYVMMYSICIWKVGCCCVNMGFRSFARNFYVTKIYIALQHNNVQGIYYHLLQLYLQFT